jgi:hypothetical protein
MSQQWPPPPGGYPPPQGYGPPPPPQPWGYGPPLQPQVVVIQAPTPRAPFNHLLHLVITLCTCGLWLPVWIILAIAH